MKTFVKKSIRRCSFITLVALTILSCKQKENTEGDVINDSVANADTMAIDQPAAIDDSFLADAAVINMEEIELGKLAQSRATSKEVKDFANMMVDGHTKSLNELKDLASQKNVTLPQEISPKGEEIAKQLKESKNFDKDYAVKMVEGHKEAIAKFESARDNVGDADVKAWIVKTLPDLEMHLEHATMVDKKVK